MTSKCRWSGCCRLDSGFIYKLFGLIHPRVEMLQEAGFHPLEVVQSATRNGAELLGMEDQIGSISPGKRVILSLSRVIPCLTLSLRNRSHEAQSRYRCYRAVGGVSYTVKDGVIYDAKALLSDAGYGDRGASGRGAVRSHCLSRIYIRPIRDDYAELARPIVLRRFFPRF